MTASYAPGGRYPIDFFVASSNSSGESSRVDFRCTAPLPFTARLIATAVATSGNSEIAYTSYSPMAK